MCDFQCFTKRAGWVAGDSRDVLMRNLKPLILGIKNLWKKKQPQVEYGLISIGGNQALFVFYFFCFCPLSGSYVDMH